MDQNTYIEQAAAHFRTLLTEQLNRQARMSQGSPAKDFSRMERIVIGLIPGDGIGPILMAQARRVLEKLLERPNRYHITSEMQDNIPLAAALHDIGKIAIDEKILNKPGKLTKEEFEQMKQHTVIGASMLDHMERYKDVSVILEAITLSTGVTFSVQGKTIIVSK